MSEIKKSDLIPEGVDDEIKKIAKEFDNLITSIDGVVNSGAKLNDTLKTGQKTREETEKLNQKAVKNADTLNKTSVKLTNLQTNYTKSLVSLNKQKQKEIKTNEKLTKKEKEHQAALKLVVKSEEDAIRQNKALRIERRKVDKTLDGSNETIEEYNALIDANTDIIAENNDKNEARVSGIGLYEKALDRLPSILKDSANGFQNFSDGANKGKVVANNFIKVPLLLVIGLIALAFAEVSAAVQKFQPVMDKISQVTAGFSAGLEVLITSLGKVGKVILSTIVLSLFKMQAGIIKARIAWNDLTGDVEESEKLQKGLEEVNKSIVETTGKIKKETEEAAESWRNMGENIVKAVKEGSAIKALEQQADQFRITSIKTNAVLEKQIAILERVSDDATRSFEERENAATKLDAAQSKLAANRLKEAKLTEQVEKRTANNIRANRQLTREEEEKLNTAIANRIQVETEAASVSIENEKRLRELKQDRLEKDLDILIDGFDNQKTINEKIIASDKETFEKRFALLDETKKLSKDTFDEQVSTIQQFTDKQIDANDLLATSDAKLLNEKIRNLGLSEIIEGRLLEVVRERRTVNQDLIESERDLSDAQIESTIKASKVVEREKQREIEAKLEALRITAKNEEEYAQGVYKLNNELIQDEIDKTKEILATADLTNEKKIELTEELADKELELNQIKNDEIIRQDEQRAEKQRALIEGVAQIATAISDAVFANREANREADLTAQEEQFDKEASDLEKLKESGAITEEEYAARSKALDDKQASEKNKLLTEQAKAKRNDALWQIAINTIVAASTTLATLGLPAAIPALIAVAAAGVASAIAVAAKPLPQFDKGTESTPRDYIAGEKRPEFRKSKGKWSLITQPTAFHNSPNDTIISGVDTANILDSGLMSSIQLNGVNNSNNLDNSKIVKGLYSLEKAVNSNKTNVIFNAKGITTIYGQSKSKLTRIDKYIS